MAGFSHIQSMALVEKQLVKENIAMTQLATLSKQKLLETLHIKDPKTVMLFVMFTPRMEEITFFLKITTVKESLRIPIFQKQILSPVNSPLQIRDLLRGNLINMIKMES